jgi:subtilisin family serine protease
MGIPDLWKETRGEGIVIATLDTGVDTGHPALSGTILAARDFTGEGIEDQNGHGTHVAGILVGQLNGAGFAGVAPKAKLLVGKVMDKYGRGASVDIARGIDWAVKSGAHIITLSVNGPEADPVLFTAIYNALAKGVMVFCGAGNQGGYKRDELGYPGNFPPVCTVGSCDQYGNVSAYSSRGGEVDVTAPGEKIYSTYLNGSYAQMSGTSMSTPVVAALAALILSKHLKNKENVTPIRNMEEMMQHIKRLTSHPDTRNSREGYGCILPFLAMYREIEIDMVKDSSITMVKDSSITMVKDSSITMVKDSSITMVKDSSITMVKDSSITMVKDSSITKIQHILNTVRVPLRLLKKLFDIIMVKDSSITRIAEK